MHDLQDLCQGHLPQIAPWFDDPVTRRWLGGRDWAENTLLLAKADTNRHGLIASIEGNPVALLDVEVYADSSASFAIVVDPRLRQRGIATRALKAMLEFTRFATVSRFFAGVEHGNESSTRFLARLGFTPTAKPSEQGFIDYELVR
ncbi:GNAT family N-acetyltransferase [Pelagibacterium nitratireducens]|uniref:GNAT family N-acetyltransferase n=1 Tax=Pelagibacterium nitratireducens TaxID=1046114 RepID=A0ABZ2I0T9_9HYPH